MLADNRGEEGIELVALGLGGGPSLIGEVEVGRSGLKD